MQHAGGKRLIGRTEYIDLPDWNIYGIRAKIDTGARSSAIHVEGVEILPSGRARFAVVLRRGLKRRRVSVEAPIARVGRVKSSNGLYSRRVFVEAAVRMGPVAHPIVISLVDRERMSHRMLLGRTALEGLFLVDVSRQYLLGRPPKLKHRQEVVE